MKKGMLIVACIGLLLTGLLIASLNPADVLAAVVKISWGIIPVLLIHIFQVVLSGLGWQVFFRDSSYRGTPFSIIFFRWLREAINNMVPITQIGGEIISIRLLILRGMQGGEAGATIVLDLTMEVVSQFLFTLLGLLLVLHAGYNGPVLEWIIIGLAVSVPVIITFFLAQNRGLFRLLENMLEGLVARTSFLSANPVTGMHEYIQLLYRRKSDLVKACFLHLLSWAGGTFEIWIIMYFIGWPVTLAEAFVLESLGQAVRSAAFFIPAGLGVQEAGYLLFGMIYHLPPEVGLALSLVKRLREILLGLPGVLAWQLLEGKQAWRKNLPDTE